MGAAVKAWSLYRPHERQRPRVGLDTWVMHAVALTVAACMRRLSATCVTTRAQYFRRAWSTPLCADGPDLCTCSSALHSGSPAPAVAVLLCCVRSS